MDGAERLVAVQEINYGPPADMGQLIGAFQRAITVSGRYAESAQAVAGLIAGSLRHVSCDKGGTTRL